ncbi:hypothetical protein TRFO_24655 [Tritrichomonas foetus]|uniref:Uncharacterized protein n=1 Tax=Tritrichomonas foetus TaxID=1144522 RepID=A0A1J4K8N6_9EUKA|nr:hypothetical protein TRFO_24655 [Tritrichomonas foetus]|eukprot:OHT07248.1 hypothetical protein TRFO_24655 [Tritrichomonas foetus]
MKKLHSLQKVTGRISKSYRRVLFTLKKLYRPHQGGMEDKRIIFESVLSRMIESFAPHLFLVLADFESQNPTIPSTVESDRILERIFKRFPRKFPQYKSMLLDLSILAESNAGQILHYVVRILKHILKGARDTPFSILQGISTSYDPNNRHHILLFHYFSLFTLTDFICQIVSNYGPGDASVQVYRAGYNVATADPLLPRVCQTLVHQWSVIFSIVSETHFSDISSIFTYFNSVEDYSLPLSLIRYLRLDSDDSIGPLFMTEIVNIVKQQHKKKTLNGKMLEALASLIITLPFSEDIYQKLYNLAYSLRHDKILSSSAILLLSSVVIRFPKIWGRHTHVFQKRVLTVVGNRNKVKKALQTFRILMFGLNLDPKWYFWQWGPNPRISSLSYIKWNGAMNIPQNEPGSFSGVFMSNFFEKSDFSVCPHDFRDVLIHLASLDFSYFTKKIVPRFLALKTDDSRFLTFLMAVPHIYSSDFVKFAFKSVTAKQVDEFSSQIKDKIMSSLSIYKKDNRQYGVCSNGNEFLSSLMGESDQKIGVILGEWSLNQFGPLLVNHLPSEQKAINFTLVDRLLPAVRYVLSTTDFSNKQTMELMVRLSFHNHSAVSTNAYMICRDIIGNLHDELEKYLSILNDLMMKEISPEATCTCLSLLHDSLKNMNEKMIRTKMFRKLEFASFLKLSSMYPETRHLAYLNMLRINKFLNNNGVMRYISDQIGEIEKNVKVKLLLHVTTAKPERIPVPTDKIDFESAILSHYYDIWTFFLAEIMNVVIASNYSPVLERISSIKNETIEAVCDSNTYRTPSDIGLLLIITSSMFHLPRLVRSNSLYQEFGEREDTRKQFRDTISNLIGSNCDRLIEMGFTLLEHVHITLYPYIFDILNGLPNETLPQATAALSIIVKNPELTKPFYKQCFRKLTHFLNNLQFLFMQMKINGPRIIQWDTESELRVTRDASFVKDYCSIVSVYFSRLPQSFHVDEWTLSARENVFRQLLNWSMTTSLSLESVRAYASNALRAIIRVCSFFNDSLLFDTETVSFFGRLEIENGPVLSNLLKFHLDLLLDTYVTATYTQPRAIADAYIEAIIDNLTSESTSKHVDFITSVSGQILLLGLVSSVREHPRACCLIDKFVCATASAINFEYSDHFREMLESTTLTELLPKIFTSMTEAVFSSVFRLLQMKNLHVPAKDIIESVRPWMKVVRLLPKQKTIAQNVLPVFNYFTPHLFLAHLMETTEAVDDDQFRSIASLWTELQKSPDHRDIVPLFISDWDDDAIKIKLFGILLGADPINVSQRLSNRCTFAFYFHVTRCQNSAFSNELWPASLLATVFDRNWDVLLPQVPTVIHYSLLFKEQGTSMLFYVLCKRLGVDCRDDGEQQAGPLHVEALRDIVDKLLLKLSPEGIAYWGEESLKWVIGCSDLQLAATSFVIYNQINQPKGNIITNAIIRTVYYHLVHNFCETKLLCQLVTESFILFLSCFEGNEHLIFNYASSFLDCRIFVETSLFDARMLFQKCIQIRELMNKVINNSVTIARPLIPRLETSKHAQRSMDELIKALPNNIELQIIIAPIKTVDPTLFPHASDVNVIFAQADDSTLCKALVHYSFLMKTSSRAVLNAIFELSAGILSRIPQNENNRMSLAKIYQNALHFMAQCPAATKFIQALCKREPAAATLGIIDVYEWDRSIENVSRGIKTLIKPDESPIVTITDCKSYTAVTRFLQSEVMPKILPFAAQREMIEGMKRVEKDHKSHRIIAYRRSPTNYGSGGDVIPTAPSDYFDEYLGSESQEFELSPLTHPEKVILKDIKMKTKTNQPKLTAKDFICEVKRSKSLKL